MVSVVDCVTFSKWSYISERNKEYNVFLAGQDGYAPIKPSPQGTTYDFTNSYYPGFAAQVYVNENSNSLVIVYRGTDFSEGDKDDMLNSNKRDRCFLGIKTASGCYEVIRNAEASTYTSAGTNIFCGYQS